MSIGLLWGRARVVMRACAARITTDMTRLFCPSCGSATLARLGVTIDTSGTPHYHYKADRRVNTRGAIYSAPAPRGGRDGGLLLREDQLKFGAWQQRAKKKTVAKSMFGDAVNGARRAGGRGGGAHARCGVCVSLYVCCPCRHRCADDARRRDSRGHGPQEPERGARAGEARPEKDKTRPRVLSGGRMLGGARTAAAAAARIT
jgi:hypothetical protein